MHLNLSMGMKVFSFNFRFQFYSLEWLKQIAIQLAFELKRGKYQTTLIIENSKKISYIGQIILHAIGQKKHKKRKMTMIDWPSSSSVHHSRGRCQIGKLLPDQANQGQTRQPLTSSIKRCHSGCKNYQERVSKYQRANGILPVIIYMIVCNDSRQI